MYMYAARSTTDVGTPHRLLVHAVYPVVAAHSYMESAVLSARKAMPKTLCGGATSTTMVQLWTEADSLPKSHSSWRACRTAACSAAQQRHNSRRRQH